MAAKMKNFFRTLAIEYIGKGKTLFTSPNPVRVFLMFENSLVENKKASEEGRK